MTTLNKMLQGTLESHNVLLRWPVSATNFFLIWFLQLFILK